MNALNENMNEYPDSKDGVRQFVKDWVEPSFKPTHFKPDPYADGVWLVLDAHNKRAIIAYLNSPDFEEVEWDEA